MIKISAYNTYIRLSLSILALISGGFVYAVFRTDNAFMFNWFGKVGVSGFIYNLRETLGDFSIYYWVKYNLPAALWLLAYLFAIASIWSNYKETTCFKFFIWLMPFMALMTEVLQLMGIIPGTFDISDILSYFIVTTLFLAINKIL